MLDGRSQRLEAFRRRRSRRAAGAVAVSAILLASASVSPLFADPGRKSKYRERTHPGKSAAQRATSPVPREAVRVSGKGWWMVESGPVQFGNVIPWQGRDIPGAIRVRVYSATPWVLKLVPQFSRQVRDHGASSQSTEGLFWQSRNSGGYQPISSHEAMSVARGTATRSSGESVIIDLRMVLDSDDELGFYGFDFRVELETR